MKSVAEATAQVLAHLFHPPVERVQFAAAAGRVLAEALRADRDFPPFDRVTMDGIALRFADFEAGQRQFRVAGMQAAGQPPLVFFEKNSCFEVMTGAVLPNGTDAVVRYEDLNLENGSQTGKFRVFNRSSGFQRLLDAPKR